MEQQKVNSLDFLGFEKFYKTLETLFIGIRIEKKVTDPGMREIVLTHKKKEVTQSNSLEIVDPGYYAWIGDKELLPGETIAYFCFGSSQTLSMKINLQSFDSSYFIKLISKFLKQSHPKGLSEKDATLFLKRYLEESGINNFILKDFKK